MENNYTHIFSIQQTEKLSDEVFQQLMLQLPMKFQQEIKAYKHWQSAQLSLLGKIVLQYGFRKLNLNYTLQDISIGEKDRPYINSAIDFNISHSGDYVVGAITQEAKVGIDIEKHRMLDVHLFRKYFNEQEWNEIQQSNNSLQLFFDLWSIKESAIKCDGRGVEVLSKTHKQYTADTIGQIICDTAVFYYQQLAISENYSCHVCLNQKFSVEMTSILLSDLLNE